MSTTAPIERFAPIVVDDPADGRLDDIRNLNESDSRPDLPNGKGLVITGDMLIVPRLVRSHFPPRTVFGTRQKPALLADGLTANEAVIAETVPWLELDREVLATVAGFDLHRGLPATASRTPELSVDQVLSGATTLTVMGGVDDHEDIGVLFRNAADVDVGEVAFGAACAGPLYRHSVCVSMGHAPTVPFTTLPNTTTTWQRSLDQLGEQSFRAVSMTPTGTMDLWDTVGTDEITILVGTEGSGLTEHAMAATDVRTHIPMSPGADSLNVATSAAIAFYERLRVQSQRAGQQKLFPEPASRPLPGAVSEVPNFSPKATKLLQKVLVRLCIMNLVVVAGTVNLYARLGGTRLTH